VNREGNLRVYIYISITLHPLRPHRETRNDEANEPLYHAAKGEVNQRAYAMTIPSF
jgi:hypothetical protein